MSVQRALRVLLALAAVAACVALLVRAPGSPGIEVERRDPPAGIDEIRVHVSGAVRAPTVVIARPGERVADVIDRAILAADADVGALNLARRVVDEDRLVVPRTDEGARLLDINRASQEELEALPGIGPVGAQGIVAARARAPFASTDDLLERRLVSARVYEDIRDLVATPSGAR